MKNNPFQFSREHIPKLTQVTQKGNVHSLQDSSLENLKLTNFLRFFVDASFLIFLCPFRLRLVENEGKQMPVYIGKSWWPQGILCAIFTGLGSLWVFREVRVTLPQGTNNPSLHFRLVANVIDSLLKLVTVKRLWLNRQDIVDAVNYMLYMKIPCNAHDTSESLKRRKNWLPIIISISLILIYNTFSLSIFIAGSGPKNSNMPWSVQRWWLEMVEAGRINFFLEEGKFNITSEEDQNKALANVSTLEEFLAVLAAIGYLQRYATGWYNI